MPRTAVAAPPSEPFEDVFAFLDQMTVRDLVVFYVAFRRHYFVLFGDGIERNLPPLGGRFPSFPPIDKTPPTD